MRPITLLQVISRSLIFSIDDECVSHADAGCCQKPTPIHDGIFAPSFLKIVSTLVINYIHDIVVCSPEHSFALYIGLSIAQLRLSLYSGFPKRPIFRWICLGRPSSMRRYTYIIQRLITRICTTVFLLDFTDLHSCYEWSQHRKFCAFGSARRVVARRPTTRGMFPVSLFEAQAPTFHMLMIVPHLPCKAPQISISNH